MAESTFKVKVNEELPAGDEIIGKVHVTDGTTDVYVEPSSQAIQVSRAIHYRVMNSNQWVVSHTFNDVAAATAVYLHIKVDAVANAHISFVISTESKVTYNFWENPTLTDDGTAMNEWSVNRETTTASHTNFFYTPTITVPGTKLETGLCGAAGKFEDAPGSATSTGYWLLKKSESYLIQAVNQDAAAKDINIIVSWHEH